jgi:uncharacterized protein (TIGR02001 family)
MFDLPPPDPAFEILVASHGMSKGLGQTDGIQVIPKAWLQIGDVQAGAQWKNISSPSADGEAQVFVGAVRKLGPYQLSAGVAYKFQTGVKGRPDDDCFEFSGGISRKWGKLALKLGAIYSPDDVGSARRSLYVEGGPAFDIGKSTRLSANLGRRQRVGGADYTAWNLGVTRTVARRLAVDLRYHDTNRSHLGSPYRARVVVSGRLSF